MTEVAAPEQVANNENPAPVSSGVEVQEANGTTPTEKTNGNSSAVSNGGAKKKKSKEPKPVVEPEPPKDPKEDPVGWVKQQAKAGIHKANCSLLNWAQDLVVEDEANRQPMGKNGSVNKTEFLSSLRDGTLLAKLANKLSPGSVESVHEGEAVKEKENQVSNVQAFINFAKEKAGLAEEQVFSVEDLREKGKAGYEAVFNTLFQIALQAQQKFDQAAIDVERIAEDVKNQPSRLSSIYNLAVHLKNTIVQPFKKGASNGVDKPVAQEGEAAEGEAATSPNADAATNGEQVNKVEVSAAPTIAVVTASEQPAPIVAN